MWLTLNRCWPEVVGRRQPKVEAMLGWQCTANKDPKLFHIFPCNFFSPHNLPEQLCAKIVTMLEAAISSGPFLAWLQTYCTLTWKLYSYQHIEAETKWTPFSRRHIFQTPFSNAFWNSWMKIYKFGLRFHWSLCPRVQLTIYQHWFR